MNGRPDTITLLPNNVVQVTMLGNANTLTIQCEDEEEATHVQVFWEDVRIMADEWDYEEYENNE